MHFMADGSDYISGNPNEQPPDNQIVSWRFPCVLLESF